MGDDDTQHFAPVQQHPAARSLGSSRLDGAWIPPRLYGWALAFTIVGTSFAFVLLVTIVLAILFADKLPTAP